MGFLAKIVFLTMFLMFILFDGFVAQNKKNCQFSKWENTLNSSIGYFGYKYHNWPENEREMSAWCSAVRRDKPAAKNFALHCLTGMSKSMGSVIVYSADKIARLYCKNKKERAVFISKGKCGNKAKKETIKCWQGLTTLVTNVKKVPDQKERIPTLCCSFFWWKNCNIEAYRKKSPICTEANIEDMEQQIDRLAIDGLNLLCSDYDESDKCAKYNKKFDLTKVPINYKTFFSALFEFFESL